jgi:hypothetical protein
VTLTPETRVLLTDALRPPAGYRVEVAVGTTYSLNLTALLLAPLSFALFDQGNADEIGTVDPIRLLEAVRRYADRTTVFCQAGGIHVPSNYRSILTFVEDSVLEVMPFHEGALFHPKVWAIRFIDQGHNRIHRVIILSRNLTLDRSWDTALVLDEDEDGAIDAAPANVSRRLTARVATGRDVGAYLASSVFLIRPDPATIDPWFLAGFLSSSDGGRQAARMASTLGEHIRFDPRRVQIPLLPIETQRTYGEAFRRLWEFARTLRAAHDEGIDFVRDMIDATAALLGGQTSTALNQVTCNQA